MTVDELKARIESVTGRPFHGANGRCPAHDDAHESLSVNQGDVAPVLTCHAGCETGDVLAAAHLRLSDLFEEAPTNGRRPRNEPEAVYPYTDENGALLFEVVRFPGKKFRQRAADGTWSLKGVRRVLYRLPEVAQAIFDAEPLWITEGEKDADALARAGVVATCNPGGAGKWRVEFTESLRGAELVIIVADRDEAGRAHARQVADALRDVVHEVRIVEAAVGKDAFDHLAAGRSVEEFVEVASSDAAANVGRDVPTPAPVVGAHAVWLDAIEGRLTVIDNGLVPADAIGRPLPPPPNVRFLRDRLAPRREGPDLPEFPTARLPTVVAEMVEAVTVAVQVPADLPAMLALAALSAATCGRLRIDAGSWSEMANLFVAVLAESAERKSAVVEAMTAPLLDAEQRLVEQAEPDILAAKARRVELKQRLENRKLPPMERVLLEEELAEIVIRRPRLMADDATEAALIQLLYEQDGRMAILSDEGGMLRTVGGRHNPKAPPVWDVLTKGHANMPLRIDRKGDERPTYVERPALTVGLAVQPYVIQDLATMPGAREVGLLARFLYSRPRSRGGYRDVDAGAMPAEVVERYRRLVVTMVESFWHRHEQVTVEANDRARAMYREFRIEAEAALRPGGATSMIGDWGGKLHGAVIRMAGVFAAAAAGGPATIGAMAMGDAIEIGRYLIPHAEHVFGERPTPEAREASEDMARVLKWAKGKGAVRFNDRDFKQSRSGSEGWTVGRAKAACAAVPEHIGRTWTEDGRVWVELR